MLTRRRLLASAGALLVSTAVRAQPTVPAALAEARARAQDLPRLRSLLVHRDGRPWLEEALHGGTLDRPVNVKSVSKVWISALVGQAIGRGALPGVEAAAVPLLGRPVPSGADPRVARITVEDLLTMRAGLQRTSGPYYGPWIASRDWVGHVLTRPFVDVPGGGMQYSTGSTHLLSAILTHATGRNTLALAREGLGAPLGVEIPPWDRDPQGIYLGGNNMGISPRGLLRFGELYRQDGLWRGERVLPEGWVKASWTPRTASIFTGDAYGYGWFMTQLAGHDVTYAWGFGGQLLYIVPTLRLTVVMTSDPASPSGSDGYAHALHTQVMARIVAAAAAA
ncbi:serine hydrolase [Achromobacter sp. GG226]|uniref:serine hydrolase domain-containing protein n=1 Tax=Verticiella alkaliphila TaxID=2779529 RepID=UPI001C0D27D0|nr:serine hydrolase [Verticiella sp. GG226]MBU4611940.1 serine hydrolase [Verticiella sp. GG226]